MLTEEELKDYQERVDNDEFLSTMYQWVVIANVRKGLAENANSTTIKAIELAKKYKRQRWLIALVACPLCVCLGYLMGV